MTRSTDSRNSESDAEYVISAGRAREDSPGVPAGEPDVDHQPKLNEQRNGGRTDRGRPHAVRDSALSRGLLETLCQHGENRRSLRRMEAGLRADLKPSGPLGKLLFDRFWSCVLRLIFVSHLEGKELFTNTVSSKSSVAVPYLRDGPVPILVTQTEDNNASSEPRESDAIEQDLFHRLALVARYDRSASREMYRTLGYLLVMREAGGKGLTAAVRAAAGIKEFGKEDGNNA
jgi:hypothetical protein